MPAILIAFATGVLACQFLPAIPAWPWGLVSLSCIAGIVGVQIYSASRADRTARYLLLLLLTSSFVAGVSYTCWRSQAVLADTLPEAAMGRNIQVTGVVDSLPDRTARGQRFQFRVEHVDSKFHVPERIQLSVWNAHQDGDASETPVIGPVKAGERWSFVVRLKRPHGLANPHGYDV
ncbi:MAG: ComEC/Rec2 family competence protein, partial [Fluviibacter sp.]